MGQALVGELDPAAVAEDLAVAEGAVADEQALLVARPCSSEASSSGVATCGSVVRCTPPGTCR